MTRNEIEPIANAVRQLRSRFIYFEIAGSYRRFCSKINNLNVVVVGDPTPIGNWFASFGAMDVCTATTMGGNVHVKYGAMDKKGIADSRVTFHVHKEEEWAAALLHWTGSESFNRMLEGRATEYGFVLDQNGLWLAGQRDERVPGIVNEASLFEALGMECIAPEGRK